jgi:VWFA-related protein
MLVPNAAFWRAVRKTRAPGLLAPILIAVPFFVVLAPQTQETPQSPKISVAVRLVRVSATVRDKHGRIVPTLNRDDFALYEDGHVETVNNFMSQSDLALTLGLVVQTGLGPRRKPALHNASAASYGFLDHMLRENKDSAFVIRFDQSVDLLQDSTSSRPKLQAALQMMQTADSDSKGLLGSTLLYDAMCLASTELTKAPEGRRAIFVLSDGIDRGSKKTLEDAIAEAQRADVSVYSILVAENWPGPNGKKVLERISTETGGRLFNIAHGQNVTQVYAQAEEELRNEYLLGYTPTPADTGAGYHRIHLATVQKGLTVQTRDGYYSER